jgi:hypothetical protein
LTSNDKTSLPTIKFFEIVTFQLGSSYLEKNTKNIFGPMKEEQTADW